MTAIITQTLIKNHKVEALCGGKIVASHEVKENYQRLNIVDFEKMVMADTVCITVQSTNGCENAHIYEIRIY